MFISRSQTQSCPSIHLNWIQLERVRPYKYLGVWISDNLSWEKHIEYTCSKARRHLGYLFQTFSPHCTPLYRAQILPILDHSVGPQPKLMLEEIQLFATRMAAKEWHSQPEILNAQFNLSSCARRHYFKMLFFFKFTNDFIFCPCLPILNPNPNLRAPHDKQFLQPFSCT